MMNITVIGASAGVGLEAVKRALDRKHNVTTLSRSEINFPSQTNLTALKGSATDKSDLLKSIKNADAVIIALGTGKNRSKTTLYSDFAKLLVEVQDENNLQIPFIIVTGFGAGKSGTYNSTLAKIFFSIFLKNVYKDKTTMEEIISASTIKWVIVRPGMLKDESLTENYRVENTLFKGIKIGSINRSDVADYLVKEAESISSLYKYISLSNK